MDDEFTPEDKYFFLYLLTNPHTALSGCYEISIKQMERETGYNADTVMRLIARMQNVHKVIAFSPDTKEILILNWAKYNWVNPKIKISVERSLDEIKNEGFKRYVQSVLAEEKESTKEKEDLLNTDNKSVSVSVVSIPYPYGIDTVSTPSTHDVNTASKPNKTETAEAFAVFWQAYPKKVGKPNAEKAFAKVPKSEWDKLLPAIETQKRSRQWRENNGQYIPYPATWLNGKRWEDEVKAVVDERETDNVFLQMMKNMEE